MRKIDSSRRKFMVGSLTGLSTTWIATNWPAAVKAAERADKTPKGSLTYFTRAQAAEIDAMAAKIFPTTDTPGAREAQVVYFIDLALVTFAVDAQPTYANGFNELSSKLSAMYPGAKSFAALSSEQQIALLTSIEKTSFFSAVRNHTVMGMFAAPQHGGNYSKVGWKLIGFDDSLNFKAPFGAYDNV
jgi:hypothetical protein